LPGWVEEIFEEAVDTLVIDVATNHNKLSLAVQLEKCILSDIVYLTSEVFDKRERKHLHVFRY
jgi:hypothetical protein